MANESNLALNELMNLVFRPDKGQEGALEVSITDGAITIANETDSPIPVEEQDAPVAEDNDAGVIKVEERYTTVAVEALGTVTHVTGAGFLRGFVITDNGASSNVLNIYDNTSGSAPKMVSQVDMDNATPGYYPVNRAFDTGLTTVLATGTAGKLYLIFENRSA